MIVRPTVYLGGEADRCGDKKQGSGRNVNPADIETICEYSSDSEGDESGGVPTTSKKANARPRISGGTARCRVDWYATVPVEVDMP